MKAGFAIMICAAMIALGCAGDKAGQRRSFIPGVDEVGPDAMWPFWPTAMRVHPLTRLVNEEGGGRLLEARVEFTDRHGHTTKASGLLRLTLYDGSPLAGGREITNWHVNLWDLAVNATQFDDVSRTYLARLQLEAGELPVNTTLVAEFHSINGVDLEAEHRLRR